MADDASERVRDRKEKERKWMEAQILGLKSWVNSFLSRREQKVENLETDFKDGVRLADFLELAAQKDLQGIDYLPKGKIQSIQNLSICLEFMGNLGIRLLGINAGTIYDGNIKLILGMLYSACRCPAITNLSSAGPDPTQKGKMSFEQQLLLWVQDRVSPYGMSVLDFKNSFTDGMVFGALIHSINPDCVIMDSLNPSDPQHNLQTVFDAAFEKMGIPKLLAVEDLVSGKVDERSVVLYATLLFHASQAARSKEKEKEHQRSLEQEQEEHQVVEKELQSAQATYEDTQREIEKQNKLASDFSEENARLRKLIESYQHRSKLEDSTIRSLETKALVLDQLSGDKDKQLFRSTATNSLLSVEDGALAGAKEASSDSSWYFVPSPGDDEEEGNVNILHCQTGMFLSLEEGGDGESSKTSLSPELGPEAVWKLVDDKEDGSLVQNKKTGEYLKLGHDGSVALSKAPDAETKFDICCKSDYDRDRRLHEESSLLTASLIEGGGSTVVRHSKSKKFVNGDGSAASLSPLLTDHSKWDVLSNKNGSARLRSKENGKFLTQTPEGVALENESAGSSWLFSRAPNSGDLVIINEKSGEFLQSGDGDSLTTSEELDPSKGGWTFQSEQEKLAAAIASALAAHGGVGLVQHGWSQAYVNHDPGLSQEPSKETEWSITANKDGTLSFQSNQTGQYLKQSKGGLGVADQDTDSSHWSVSLGPDRSVFLANRTTGEYLIRGADGAFQTSCKSEGKSGGWVIRSEDGQFSTNSENFHQSALGISLAEALSASGGGALLQHGATKTYVSDQLDLLDESGKNTEWQVEGHPDGSWSLKSKGDGRYLSLDESGNVALNEDGNSVVSHWTVSRGLDGNLVLRNKGTGDYLERGDDGKLGVNPTPDESKSGWVVKSDDGVFSSDGGAAGGTADSGFTLRELDERTRSLKRDIDAAKAKVQEEKNRRMQLDQEFENMKDYANLTALRADEARKTLDEMGRKVDQLRGLFDEEQGEKTKAEEARANAEQELKDKEQMLRDLAEKKEKIARQLDASKAAAQKEIAERKRREAEIRRLEAAQAALKKDIVVSGKTLAGLDSLKRNLEEHLEDLAVWAAPAERKEDVKEFNFDEAVKSLQDKSFKDQIGYLDDRLRSENQCLRQILKIQDGEERLEEKVVRDGWLLIKGRNAWKQRWCVLSGHLLRYYNSQDTSETADGCVDLGVGCDIVRQKALKEGKGKVWPLKLSINSVEEGGNIVVRKLFLRAGTKAERHSWFTAISCATTRINYLADAEKTNERPDTRILAFVKAGEGTPIHELFVDYRPITPAGCNALRKGILYHDNILTLSLQQAGVGDEGVIQLSTALDKVTDLRILRLNGNSLTSASVKGLLKALCLQNSSLREIDLSNNSLDSEAFAELVGLLKDNPQLTSFNLSTNILGDQGVGVVTGALGQKFQEGRQAKIANLEFNHNKIGNAGAKSIAELLAINPNISSLSLSGNLIGDEGAALIAAAVATNHNIRSVDLSGNQIGAEGALAFKASLDQNPNLNSLDLSSNPGLNAEEKLAELLRVNEFSVSSLVFVRREDIVPKLKEEED